MPNFPSARGNKHEEDVHRALETNLIGTLRITGGNLIKHRGIWTPGKHLPEGLTLAQCLTLCNAMGRKPLLWAFRQVDDGNTRDVLFGFDKMVSLQQSWNGVGKIPQAKIGHVALASSAVISGEIKPNADATGWIIDNESGAWGAMGGVDGKTAKLAAVAQMITDHDPGEIQVTSGKAFSRNSVLRYLQHKFR